MDFDEILTIDKVESILSEKAHKLKKRVGCEYKIKKNC